MRITSGGDISFNGGILINGNGTTQNGTLLFKQGGALAFNTTGYSGIGILGTTSMHFRSVIKVRSLQAI